MSQVTFLSELCTLMLVAAVMAPLLIAYSKSSLPELQSRCIAAFCDRWSSQRVSRGSTKAMRSNEVILCSPVTIGSRTLPCHGDLPCPRIFHAACMLGPTMMVVFGGRTNPTTSLSDLYVLDLPGRAWAFLQPIGERAPMGRWRHTLTQTGPGVAVLFGGRTITKDGEQTLNDVWLLQYDGCTFPRSLR